jgi:hydroxymethylpyrimidine/phosphomethylpyrimidine kinase
MNSLCVIGGLDPTGHAGVLRDLQTAGKMGVEAHLIITALAAQNDRKYFGMQVMSIQSLAQQWDALPFQKIAVVKIGMLASVATLRFLLVRLNALKRQNKKLKIVWDPVFRSSSGGELLSPTGIRLAIQKLTPLCTVVTPNAEEMTAFVSGDRKNLAALCQAFWQHYQVPVYFKGGHLPTRAHDWFYDGKKITELTGKISRKKIRGTGCFLASAIAGGLASGESLIVASQNAKKMIAREFR